MPTKISFEPVPVGSRRSSTLSTLSTLSDDSIFGVINSNNNNNNNNTTNNSSRHSSFASINEEGNVSNLGSVASRSSSSSAVYTRTAMPRLSSQIVSTRGMPKALTRPSSTLISPQRIIRNHTSQKAKRYLVPLNKRNLPPSPIAARSTPRNKSINPFTNVPSNMKNNTFTIKNPMISKQKRSPRTSQTRKFRRMSS